MLTSLIAPALPKFVNVIMFSSPEARPYSVTHVFNYPSRLMEIQ